MEVETLGHDTAYKFEQLGLSTACGADCLTDLFLVTHSTTIHPVQNTKCHIHHERFRQGSRPTSDMSKPRILNI